MKKSTIAFIGAGNMAEALIVGLIKNHFPAKNIWASDLSVEKLTALQEKFAIQTSPSNREAVMQADVVILAVKPNHVSSVCEEIKDLIVQRQLLVISVAVGITVSLLQDWIGANFPIILAMPNLPAMIGLGATGLYANPQVEARWRDFAEKIFRSVGVIVWLQKETEMNLVCAISGCGPGYFFYIMEGLLKAATDLGMNKDTARLLIEQTVLGSATIALESKQSFKELYQRVASPGGTTEAALTMLQQCQIHETLTKALQAATHRFEEVKQSFTLRD